MRSSRRPFSRGYRHWVSPLAAFVLSIGLGILPRGAKNHFCAFLERSVFYPYRFAVGWGPRSLTAWMRDQREIGEQAELRWRMDQTLAALGENARLRRLLGFERRGDFELVAATVVGRGRAHLGDLLVVEPADPDKVVGGQAVLAPEGLVGSVITREGRFARVACLRDLEVAVSVLDQRSREGGILKWNPGRTGLAIEAIPGQTDWQTGDRVVTSGYGLAFPKGVLVGWVSGQKMERGGLLKTVLVRPAAPAGRLDEVFVLRVAENRSFPPGPGATESPALDVSSLYPADSSVRTWRNLGPGASSYGAAPEPVP